MSDIDRETGEALDNRLPTMPESRPQNLVFASQSCAEIFGALAEMQGQMPAPKRTKTAKVKGQTRGGSNYEYEYSYAPLEEIIAAIKSPMAASGLAYRQFLASRDGNWVMRTVIAHRSGEWTGCDYPLFWDQARGMQGFASGVTYARRYGLMLALGIAAEDDDDGNIADGQIATISSPRAAPKAPTRSATQKAAEPKLDDADLKTRYEELRKEIDSSRTIDDLLAVEQMPAWAEFARRIIAARGEKVGEEALDTLRARIERHRALLLGEKEYEV